MVTTMCSKCRSIEHTIASINARCVFCTKGIMELIYLSEGQE